MNLATQRGYLLLPVVMVIAVVAAVALLISIQGASLVQHSVSLAQRDRVHYVTEAGLQHAVWNLQAGSCTGYADIPPTSFGDHTYAAVISPKEGSPVQVEVTGMLASGASETNLHRVAVYSSAPSELAMQPHDADAFDANLEQIEPDRNNFSAKTLKVGQSPVSHALLRFDLSAIPSDARLIRAELRLYLTKLSGSGELFLHSASKAWQEEGVTWNSYDGVNLWDTPGGDYAATEIAGAQLQAIEQWYLMNITGLANEWLSHPGQNFGLLLRTDAGISSAEFISGDEKDRPTLAPLLLLEFVCECGGDCAIPETAQCTSDFLADSRIGEMDASVFGNTQIGGLGYIPEGAAVDAFTAQVGGAWASVDALKNLFLTDVQGNLLKSCVVTSGPMQDTFKGVSYVEAGTHAGRLAVVSDHMMHNYLIYLDSNCVVHASWNTGTQGVTLPSGVAYIGTTASGSFESSIAIADASDSTVILISQAGVLQKTMELGGFVLRPEGLVHIRDTDKLLVLDGQAGIVYVIDMLNFAGAPLAQYDLGAHAVVDAHAIAINRDTCLHAVGDKETDKIALLDDSGAAAPPPPAGGQQVTVYSEADTYLEGGKESNFGNKSQVSVGRAKGGKILHGLLRFDLSAIPAGSAIQSAHLRLYQYASNQTGSFGIGAHRIDQAWTELGATWSTADGSTAWTGGAGGTYSNPALQAINVTIGQYQWYEWSIANVVQEWVEAPPVSSNFGVQMIYSSAPQGAYVDFASRDHSTADWHPQLVIEYTPP